MEALSWAGSFLLAACGLPLVIEAIRTRKVDISPTFLYMWGFGEVFTAIYVIYKEENALTFNYVSNIIFIAIILFIKYFVKEK